MTRTCVEDNRKTLSVSLTKGNMSKVCSFVHHDAEKDDDDKEPPPPGNGMVLDNYSWTQQLSDLQVTVPVPPGTKSRMLNVDIRKNKLTVGLKGQPPLMDGELHKTVIVEDCMWTLEDSKEISISLQKEDKMN